MVPETIRFVNAPIKVGQVTLTTSEEETKMAFASPGPDGEPESVLTQTRARHVRREEIVAVREGIPERQRVTFIEDVTTTDTNGVGERTVGPLAGLTFEVERKTPGGSLGVFDPGGAPARFGIAAQVSGQYRHFGHSRPETAELPVGPQRVGQSSRELAQALIAGVARGATITGVESAEALLADILEGPEGTLLGRYQIALKVNGSSGGSKVTMSLSGTLLVRDADGAILELKLQGPVTSEPDAPGGATELGVPSGMGEFKLSQTVVYGQA
jgi:hypothetical protein